MMKYIVFIVFLLLVADAQRLKIERVNFTYDFKLDMMRKCDNIVMSVCDTQCTSLSRGRNANTTLSQVELIDVCGCEHKFIPSLQTTLIYGDLNYMCERNNKTKMGIKMFSISEDSNTRRNSYAYMNDLAHVYIN